MERISKSELSRVAALTRKKHRREQGKLIVEGWRLLGDALDAGALESVIVQADAPRPAAAGEILSSIQKKNIQIYSIRAEDVGRISSAVTPPGVLGVARFGYADAKKLLECAAGKPVVYLHEVGDPGNVGTILRTSHALGAGGVVLSPGSCDPTNAKAARSSMGALFRIPVAVCAADELFAAARERGCRITATSSHESEKGAAKRPESLREMQPVLIVFGSEPHGIPNEIAAKADAEISIPVSPGAESLNVAAACAILLYVLRDFSDGGMDG
ncbi:MAG: TrmH family RNA methyltransferase [Planctomycetota bacterium]|jgi:TrmH family RNA methyltransferase